jgi:uncharacterized membrane protein YgaE (UPF0421/DUF939 family)
MRYFLVTYVLKPDGKIDEQVEITKNLKEKDITTCNIILDFKEKNVQKNVIQGQSMNLKWDALIEYYKNVYPDQIAELEKLNET